MSKQRWCIIGCHWQRAERMHLRTCAAYVRLIIRRCTIKCGERLVGAVQQGEMLVDELERDTSMNEGGFSRLKGLNSFDLFEFFEIL